MRELLAFLLGTLFTLATSAGETLCQANEKVIFSCRIKSSPKIVSICSSSNLTWNEGYLQYRFGTQGHIDLMFPGTKVNTQNQFRWEEHRPYQSFSKTLWFQNNGYAYTVFSDEISDELIRKPPGGKNKYGVNVFKVGDENWKRTFECEVQPTGHFDLRDVLPE